MPLEAVTAEAYRREHERSLEGVERLDEELGPPAWDPHGHVIPAPESPVPASLARSLLDEGVPGSRPTKIAWLTLLFVGAVAFFWLV